MTTIREIITDAYRMTNAVALGEVPTANEAQDALVKLRRMLSAWATESLAVFARTPHVFTLTAGVGTYTLGAGGTLNMPRPARIQQAYMRSPQNYDYPVLVSNDYSDYSVITAKNVSSNLPIFLYNDNRAPLQTIQLWPIPSDAVNQLVIWTTDVIGDYTTLDDIVTLPDGYEEAIVSNLAMRLVIPGMPVPDYLPVLATKSLAVLKRANYQPSLLKVDNSLMGDGIYDIVTDKPVGMVN